MKSDIEAALTIVLPILLPISIFAVLILPIGFAAGSPDSVSDYLLVMGVIGGPIGLYAARNCIERSVISPDQTWLLAAMAFCILPVLLVLSAISLQSASCHGGVGC